MLVDLSLKRCAEVTGLSYDCLRELHTKTHIIEAQEEARKHVAEKAEVDAAWVLMKQVEIFERCMQSRSVRDRKGEPVYIEGSDGALVPAYTFDSAGANRALELIGKHKAVNAFKETDSDRKPDDQDWKVTVVHTTKESYERAVNEQRSEQARQH